MTEPDINPDLDRLYGHMSVNQFFGEGELKMAPFPRAGGLKRRRMYDEQIAGDAIRRNPPELVDIDPRTLSSTQPHVTKGGVQYYESPEYNRTGQTYRDMEKDSNRFPVVYSREDPQGTTNLILSGHHRATEALLNGHPLRAINPRGPMGGPI